MPNSADPDQTAPMGAVCSGSTLFASILYWSVLLGNYLQQTTSADDIFRYIFLGVLRVNPYKPSVLLVRHQILHCLLTVEYKNDKYHPTTLTLEMDSSN